MPVDYQVRLVDGVVHGEALSERAKKHYGYTTATLCSRAEEFIARFPADWSLVIIGPDGIPHLAISSPLH